jgi:hypothetical protein
VAFRRVTRFFPSPATICVFSLTHPLGNPGRSCCSNISKQDGAIDRSLNQSGIVSMGRQSSPTNGEHFENVPPIQVIASSACLSRWALSPGPNQTSDCDFCLRPNFCFLQEQERAKFFVLSQNGQAAMLDVFLQLHDPSFDVGMLNEEGKTALHVAAARGKIQSCKVLLRRGADLKPDTQGEPLLQYSENVFSRFTVLFPWQGGRPMTSP